MGTLSEVHGVISTTQKLKLLMVMRSLCTHHKNYWNMKKEQMISSIDTAKDTMIIISYLVFTFSIQIKKEALAAAGWLRRVSYHYTFNFLKLSL